MPSRGMRVRSKSDLTRFTLDRCGLLVPLSPVTPCPSPLGSFPLLPCVPTRGILCMSVHAPADLRSKQSRCCVRSARFTPRLLHDGPSSKDSLPLTFRPPVLVRGSQSIENILRPFPDRRSARDDEPITAVPEHSGPQTARPPCRRDHQRAPRFTQYFQPPSSLAVSPSIAATKTSVAYPRSCGSGHRL